MAACCAIILIAIESWIKGCHPVGSLIKLEKTRELESGHISNRVAVFNCHC